MPHQETGTRPSRALPYEFHVTDKVRTARVNGTLTVSISNTGSAGAAFIVYDYAQLTRPRKYAVEAGKAVADMWHGHLLTGKYDLSLHGPNGFVRKFTGTTKPSQTAGLDAAMKYDASHSRSAALLSLRAGRRCSFTVVDNSYGAGPWTLLVDSTATITHRVAITGNGNWYDLTVTSPGCDTTFSRRFMGRVETGESSVSDPAIATAAAKAAATPQRHLPAPSRFRGPFPWKREACAARRGRLLHKDSCPGGAKVEL